MPGNPLQNLLKAPAAFLEAGVKLLDTGVIAMRDTLENMSGRDGDKSTHPPVDGPRNAQAALADFANTVLRVGYTTPLGVEEMMTGAGDLLRAAKRSLGYRSLNDPRILAMPLELPLNAGALVADIAMKFLTVYTAAGTQRTISLMRDAFDIFSDSQIFMTLRYKQQMERYEERVAKEPEDYYTRLQLGRMYIKCGMYDQAVSMLESAAKDPGTRGRAEHEILIAQYRAGRPKEAVIAGVEAMKVHPENERTRHVLWLAAHALGGYPPTVPAEFRMEIKSGYAEPTVKFTDIAPKIGIVKTNAGRGSAVFDYNNDGWLDIAVTGQWGAISLYRNNGDGTFTDVSAGSGLDKCYESFGIVAGDYDNDGFQDLFITRLGFFPGEGVLFHNNGDGTFTDVTEKSGLKTWGPAFSAHWVDYDCDGRLDLFISYNVTELFDGHVQNRLFHNNGDGTFSDVTQQAGIYTSFTTIGSAWGDYDNDGYPDLFLSSGIGRPLLFHNNGDGTFTDVSHQAGFEELLFGFICCFCDYDNDGWLDIVQILWSDHEDFVYTLRNGKGPDDGWPMRIYHNNRDGTFTKKDREIGLDGCWGTMGANLGDFNNDGWLDVALGNGSPKMERMEPPVTLEFDGTRFRNTTFAAGLAFTGKGHGVNFADLFGNGRLSLILPDGGAYPGELLATSVYYPTELTGNYLNVRLTGTKSNRDALGARITLHAGGKLQMREVTGGTSFGWLPAEQHFGLAKTEKIDALEIRWPSGLRQRVVNPPVNTSIRITEGKDGWAPTYKTGAAEVQL